MPRPKHDPTACRSRGCIVPAPQNIRRSAAVTAALLVAGIVSLNGCSCRKKRPPETPRNDPEVVAKVGDVEIRVADYRQEVERRHAARQVAADPELLLQDMIDHQVLVQKAQKLGLENDPDIRRTYENLLVGRLRARELQNALDAVDVSDAAIRQYYDTHRDEFGIPAKMRIAVLVRTVRSSNREEIAESLRLVRKELEGLPDNTVGFGALAISNSEDQVSRYRGGDMGWLTVGQSHPRLPDEVLEAAGKLAEPGQLTDIVDTRSGLYLVRLIDRKDAALKPLEQVAGVIRRTLTREKEQAVERDFLEAMRHGIETKVNRQVLQRAAAPYIQTARDAQPEQPPALP